MARLPTPGGDNGNWGNILNDYLSQSHKSDGTLKDDSVGSTQLQDDAVTTAQIADGAITNSQLADGTIAEAKLASTVQTKLNATDDWNTLSNKPAVIAAGADQPTARAALGVFGTDDINSQAAAMNPSSIAVRIPVCRMGIFDNSTTKTFQATFELVDDFDAVRIIFGSNDRDASSVITSASVSTPSAASDVNNSSGSWTAATRQGQTSFSIPVAANGSDQVAFTVTDWVAVPSVARTDGGTYPLVTVRAYMTASSTLPVLGNGTDDFTNWASRSDGGRKFWWRYQNGDQITVPSGFTSTTNTSQSPIFGVQYLCRGQVITVGAVGDSIAEGRGTYLGEGFVLPALEQLNAAGGPIKYEYANFGWAGQSSVQYTRRALSLLESEVKPDVIVLPNGTPNDTGGTLTSTIVSTMRARRARIVAAAYENDVIPVIWTWIPCNTSVHNWGSSDSLRTSLNAEAVASVSRNLLVADTASAVSGATSGGQVQYAAGMTTDGVHPNDAGNTALAATIQPILLSAFRRTHGGRRQAHSSRTDAPVFAVSASTASISRSGTWIYRGTSAGTWTLPPLNPDPARQDSQIITVKAGEYSGGVFVNRNGSSDVIDIGGVTTSSVILKTGQSATFVPGGANRWDVIGFNTAVIQALTRSSATTLTIDKQASVYTFDGTVAALWTLPLIRVSGQTYEFKNIGSATLTIQRAVTDQIYDAGLVTSIDIAPGRSRELIFNGVYWVTLGLIANPIGMCLPLVGVNGSSTLQPWAGVNRGVFVRIDRGGSVSKVRIEVGTSSGNISVAAYRNSGVGISSVPSGAPLASSGAVTCPATGIADVLLGSTVYLNDGDWLFLSCDNTSATFRGVGNATQGLFSGSGLYARQDSAHPAPTVSTLGAAAMVPILVGLP